VDRIEHRVTLMAGARATLRRHRPAKWLRAWLGRVTTCKACGDLWPCPATLDARATVASLDPPAGWAR